MFKTKSRSSKCHRCCNDSYILYCEQYGNWEWGRGATREKKLNVMSVRALTHTHTHALFGEKTDPKVFVVTGFHKNFRDLDV